MFWLICQLNRHAYDIALRLSAGLSVCQGFILCIPRLCACAQDVHWLIVCPNTALPLRQSERCYFGPQLVILWLHLQEAFCHLALTAHVVGVGTQTMPKHSYAMLGTCHFLSTAHMQTFSFRDHGLYGAAFRECLSYLSPSHIDMELRANKNNNKLICCSFARAHQASGIA